MALSHYIPFVLVLLAMSLFTAHPNVFYRPHVSYVCSFICIR